MVHVDGAARPQIVTMRSNLLLYKILYRFFQLTGIPVLVDTSLNVHEEPNKGHLVDSIRVLRLGAIDVLATPLGVYSKHEGRNNK